MLVDIIREIFNFPINVDEVVDELCFLYEREEGYNNKADDKSGDKQEQKLFYMRF